MLAAGAFYKMHAREHFVVNVGVAGGEPACILSAASVDASRAQHNQTKTSWGGFPVTTYIYCVAGMILLRNFGAGKYSMDAYMKKQGVVAAWCAFPFVHSQSDPVFIVLLE